MNQNLREGMGAMANSDRRQNVSTGGGNHQTVLKPPQNIHNSDEKSQQRLTKLYHDLAEILDQKVGNPSAYGETVITLKWKEGILSQILVFDTKSIL